MKKIEAVIKEEHLDEVKEALSEAGFVSMTVSAVKGRGTRGGIQLEWRAGSYRVDFLAKIMVMLVVKDEDVKPVCDVIVNVCRKDPTGGAGKIFVSTVDEVIRIRTGERDNDVL